MRTKSLALRWVFSLVFILLSTFVSGCANLTNLPLVNGSRIEYTRSSPISSAHVVAEGVSVTDTEVKADSIKVDVSYPFVGSINITIEDYKRTR